MALYSYAKEFDIFATTEYFAKKSHTSYRTNKYTPSPK